MTDDSDIVDADDDDEVAWAAPDKVAARTAAFTKLLHTTAGVEDAELRREGLLMLQHIRKTIRALPQGELRLIAGGKS